MQVLAACEDLPEEHNRVTLDPALTDSDGIPAPKITYRLSENSRRMLAHGLERGRELMRAAGAVEILETPLLRAGGWHLLGRSEEHTSELQSLMRISYAVFCL